MAPIQPRKSGRFVKKSELERREKANESIHILNARRKANRRDQQMCNVVGSRIVDLSKLAESLWCFDCDKPLSLRDIQSEKQMGLASVLIVKCRDCLDVVEVATSSRVLDSSGLYPLYEVNYKAALGCLNSSVRLDNFNTVLTTMNIPQLSRPTFKRAQDRVGQVLKEAAQVSCEKTLVEEKQLTVAASVAKRKDMDDDPDQPE